ncbi:DUF5133 domain-containing protein [Streptomyces sp. NPDC101227]|uniref:DUF5133 domain-containing protein n=1 Tax=Streptomyces sp. NPDC101227 TaxID=3366136 RepID=UPI003805EEE5
MLMAHPAILQGLTQEYRALELLSAGQVGDEMRQRMDDLAYTLCVSTGTSDVDAALIAAEHHLPGARVKDDSSLTV